MEHGTINRGADREQPVIPVCAIGASAGGVKALQSLFAELSDDLGLAYVVVVHLAPDHPSQLSEILAGKTAMPVLQVDDSPELKANQVYVIAPDRELVIEDDHVTSRPISVPRGRRAPIDLFFRSVAHARGDGLAVVLSGAGSDGALGVKAIKEAGGVIFAQEPTEAEFPMMPRNAIATGIVDFVGPVRSLAERIAEVTRSKHALRDLREESFQSSLNTIIAFLRARTGHDFSAYKQTTLSRRVTRRMQVTRQTSFDGYLDYLRTHPEESQELFSDLLISVTLFFRDANAFQVRTEKAIRQLFDNRNADHPMRVWVVGCATGEEAYSLAILILEEAERRKVSPSVQIFASDLDEGALATAREGRYPKSIEADVSEDRLRRHFVDDGGYYRIRKEVRDVVLFSSHSALKDPPFIRLDLISCRNVLIYLERELQRRLCDMFHYALNPGGFLFLGTAEAADYPELFDPVDRDARIYTARPIPGRRMPSLPMSLSQLGGPSHHPHVSPLGPPSVTSGRQHEVALEQSAPPSVLVDSDHRVLHLSASAGRFILPSEGSFSSDVTQLVRPELRVDLKLALQRALEDGDPSLTLPIPVVFESGSRRVVMHVAPHAPSRERAISQAVVFFLDGGSSLALGDVADMPDADRVAELRRLTEALTVAQQSLSESRREYESATQELRAANEELQSINEEYRSTAEELETSKEELQSMNEELQTVNTELKSKLEGISSAHNDLQNLMAATDIGTLFLDAELRIKLMTPAVTTHFNITDADIGRSLSDFTHRLVYESIEEDARKIVRDLTPIETEVATKDGRWLMMRLRPYRTTENRIEGVVLTLFDVTARREAETELRRSEERYRSLFESMDEGFLLARVLYDSDNRPVDLLYVDAKSRIGRDAQERAQGAAPARDRPGARVGLVGATRSRHRHRPSSAPSTLRALPRSMVRDAHRSGAVGGTAERHHADTGHHRPEGLGAGPTPSRWRTQSPCQEHARGRAIDCTSDGEEHRRSAGVHQGIRWQASCSCRDSRYPDAAQLERSRSARARDRDVRLARQRHVARYDRRASDSFAAQRGHRVRHGDA